MNESGNIILGYPMRILFAPGMETVLFTNEAEVFMDEHGVEWIKFVAKNGPGAHKEHMIRTDQIVIVRDN